MTAAVEVFTMTIAMETRSIYFARPTQCIGQMTLKVASIKKLKVKYEDINKRVKQHKTSDKG